MSNLSFYMNGVPCEPPENWAETEVELSFENDSPVASVRINTFDFVGDNAKFINNWKTAGILGGVGVYEGIPFRIAACGGTTIFDGVLDLTAASNLFDCDRCTVALRANTQIDWLTDVADSFSFAYLYSTGLITSNDYVRVPYCINSIPNYTNAALMLVTEFMFVRETVYIGSLELPDSVKKVIYTWAQVYNGNYGMISLLIAYILELVSIILYILAVIAASYYMWKELFNNLIQDDKYKYGMYVRDLFVRACKNLKINFYSTLLDVNYNYYNDTEAAIGSGSHYRNLTIIPQKYTITDPTKFRNNVDDVINQNAYGYFDGTFGDLIRAMNEIFNAKIRIVNDTLIFERYNDFQYTSSFTLPDIVAEPHGINASELASNYFVSWQTDSDDINTYETKGGLNAQCIFIPHTILDPTRKNLLFKNLIQKNLIFARVRRKEDLTPVEEVFEVIWNAFIFGVQFNLIIAATSILIVNGILNLLMAIVGSIALFNGWNFNPIGLPVLNFNYRIGFMLLDTDFIGVPKICITESGSGKIDSLDETVLSAEYILKNYHNYSFILDENTIDTNTGLPVHNQWLTYRDKEIPFCCADYGKIINNNYIRDFNGRVCKVKKLLWSPEKDEARIDYDVKQQWTANVAEQFIVDGNSQI